MFSHVVMYCFYHAFTDSLCMHCPHWIYRLGKSDHVTLVGQWLASKKSEDGLLLKKIHVSSFLTAPPHHHQKQNTPNQAWRVQMDKQLACTYLLVHVDVVFMSVKAVSP